MVDEPCLCNIIPESSIQMWDSYELELTRSTNHASCVSQIPVCEIVTFKNVMCVMCLFTLEIGFLYLEQCLVNFPISILSIIITSVLSVLLSSVHCTIRTFKDCIIYSHM